MITESDVAAALPPAGFLRDYVYYASRCTDAHAAFHLNAGLVLLAQACPIDYHFPFGQPIYSNLFGLAVGLSGDRKSASISVARDVLSEAIPSGCGEVPGSREALIDGLKVNPRQAIFYSEFGSFLASADRSIYTPMKTTFTEAWDASPLGRTQVKKQGTEAKTPRLSLLAGCTPDYLERHTEASDWMGGFMARFLCMFVKRERNYSVPPGDPVNRPRVVAKLKDLDATQNPVVRGQCLGFDPAARAEWDVFYHEMDTFESPNEAAGAVRRAPSQTLKIALLLAWDYGQARSGMDWYITPAELRPAIAITKFHTDSVLRVGDHLAPDQNMRDRRRVLDAIGESPRALGAIMRESKLLKRRVGELLETLMEEGYVVPVVAVEHAGLWYRRVPEHVRVAKLAARTSAAATAGEGAGGQVIQFPVAQVAVGGAGSNSFSSSSDGEGMISTDGGSTIDGPTDGGGRSGEPVSLFSLTTADADGVTTFD